METTALQLCCNNLQRNNITYINNIDTSCHNNTNANDNASVNASSSSSCLSKCIVQKLRWGNTNDHNHLIHTLQQQQNHHRNQVNIKTFDIIVAADIIYPSTCQGQIIYDLFRTVHELLCPNHGIFYISYCNRDYTYQTIRTLINVATSMNFIISTPPNKCSNEQHQHPIYNTTLRQKYLPPLLDGQILIFQRCTYNDAKRINDQIGSEQCNIFPNIQNKYIQYQKRMNTSCNDDDDDVWDEPPIFDDENKEDDDNN
jgi:hypothetical protein